MLVLSRKEEQTLWIGPHIRVTIVKFSGASVRIGIEAPDDYKILREELVPEAWGTQDSLVALADNGTARFSPIPATKF